MSTREITPFGLRLQPGQKETVKDEAERNRRSLNREIAALIEDGFKWRQMLQKQAQA